MEDAQQIHNLFSNASEGSIDQFSDVQWNFISDSNTGSGNIQFDTLPLMGQPSVLADAFLSIPISLYANNVAAGFGGDYRGSGGRTGTNPSATPAGATKIAFKGGNQSIFSGVQVQLQSGPTIINDQNSPFFLNQIRPGIEMSSDAVATVGAECGLFPPKFPHYFKGSASGSNWAFGVDESDTSAALVLAKQRQIWSQTHELTPPILADTQYAVSGSVGSATNMLFPATAIFQSAAPATPLGRPCVFEVTTTSATTGSVRILDPGAGFVGLGTVAVVIAAGSGRELGSTAALTVTLTLAQDTSIAAPNLSKNPLYNSGYQKSVRAFWQNMTATSTSIAGATVYQGLILVRLKDIHDGFNAMDFPIVNTRLTLTFNLASPFNTSSPYYAFQLGPETAPPIACIGYQSTAAAFAAPYAGGQCRLYVKTVRFNAGDAARMERALADGLMKSMNFLEGEAQLLQANHTSSALNAVVNLATTNCKRVWLIGAPVGPTYVGANYNNIPGFNNGGQHIGQPYAPFTGTGRLLTANLLVNQKPWRDLNYDRDSEFWIGLRSQMRGAGNSWSEGSQISYDDWLGGSRLLYCWDLSRVGNRLDKNQPIQLNFQATRSPDTPNATIFTPVDWWMIIEKESNVKLVMSSRMATVSKTY